jgi:hypothetical protein
MIEIPPPASGARYSLDDGEIFFRAEERALRDRFCDQIVRDGMSLAIIGANDACIDHYCRMLVKRLMVVPEIELEVHSPTSTEELLDRFNEILTSLSTAQAMDRRNPLAPLRILILSKADQINPAGARLLARLVNSFPGANTQLILLQPDSAREALLDLFGKRLLRWFVPLPSREDAMAMHAAARQAGLEDETIKLLQKVNPDLRDQPLWEAILTDEEADARLPAPELEGHAFAELELPEVQALAQEKAPEDKERKGRLAFSTVLISIVTITFAALTVALLFPRQTDALRSVLAKPDAPVAVVPVIPPPVAPAAPETAKIPATPAAPAASVAPAAPSAPEAAATRLEGKVRVPSPVAAAPGDSATLARLNIERAPKTLESRATPAVPPVSGAAVVAPPVVAPAVVAPSVPPAPDAQKNARNIGAPAAANATLTLSPKREAQAPAPLTSNAVPAKTTSPAKADAPGAASPKIASTPAPSATSAGNSEALQAAMKKVRSAPAQHFFVQHIALDSYVDAQEWQRANPPLAKSLIAPVRVAAGDRVKYVICSGPFPSHAAAEAFSKRTDIPTQPWLRTAASLAKALAQ